MSAPIICLMGPTASGKTQLAIDLLQYFPFEIISVDSAMVYRGMDIGTAKPDAVTLQQAPHRLIDFCDPKDAYSAAQFKQDVLREIDDVIAKGKIPLLVGGTMMYFRALQQGIAEMPAANAEVREKLLHEGQALGWPALHERLQNIDPIAAARIHPHDSQRIQRALEVYMVSGKAITAWRQEGNQDVSHEFVSIAIAPHDRKILHERIALRFAKMLTEGLIEEVKILFARGDLHLDTPAIRSVGYRQVWEFLEGKCTYAEMQEKGIAATRQLAKRQLTWLRSWPDVTWFDSEDKNLLQHVKEYLISIV